MASTAAGRADGFRTIPVIDLGPLRRGEPRDVAAQLRRAASEHGFFYVMNHGVPQRTIDAALAAAAAFFALPEKRKLAVRADGRRRGFSGPGAADGRAVAGVAAHAESFSWGTELPAGVRRGRTGAPAPRVRNAWPDRAVPQMRHALQRYERAVVGCGRDLLRGLALALDLPEGFFLARFERPLARGAVIHEPPGAAGGDPGAPYTDDGCLTLRWQDANGGLSVMDRGGAWAFVPPVPGTLVVGIGELMARWTDELFAATPHRTAGGAGGRARFVVPVHIDPDIDAVVDPAEVSPEQKGPRRHPAMRASDYILARANAAVA